MKSQMVVAILASMFSLTSLVFCSACQSTSVSSKIQTTTEITLPGSTSTTTSVITNTLATLPSTQTPTITQSGDLVVQLINDHTPPIRGTNIFQVFVTDATGQAISEAEVSYDLIMTNMNMGKNVVNATRLGDGYYTGKVYLSMSGPWRVTVSIKRAGQVTMVSFDFMVK
jgi:hypothetical protein